MGSNKNFLNCDMNSSFECKCFLSKNCSAKVCAMYIVYELRLQIKISV